MVPCSWHFEHRANELHVWGWICVCKVEQGRGGCAALCSRWSWLLCVCVCIVIGWALKGVVFFWSLEVTFFLQGSCMYMVVLNATHSCTRTSVPSHSVSVRPVLLVVAGITSQGLHSLTMVTQWGWFACKNHLWMPMELLPRPSSFTYLFLLLLMLVELIFRRQNVVDYSAFTSS